MEKLNFVFSNGRLPAPKRKILVGVVSSGNLEILIEPDPSQQVCAVKVNTTTSGFSRIWQTVLNDFFEKHPHLNMKIMINDAGSTPAVVRLRLDQAIELAMEDSK